MAERPPTQEPETGTRLDPPAGPEEQPADAEAAQETPPVAPSHQHGPGSESGSGGEYDEPAG